MSDDASSHPFASTPSRSKHVQADVLPPLRDPYDSGPAMRGSSVDAGVPLPGALVDPYLPARPLPPGGKAPLSQLAVAGVLTLLLGPIGALASIAFGFAARREIRRARGAKRGRAAATTAIALGAAFTIGWAGLFVLAIAKFGALQQQAEASDSPGTDSAGPDRDDEPDPQQVGPRPIPKAPIPGLIFAPKETKTAKVGGIQVVDIGQGVSSFNDELAKQRAEAQSAGQKLLVMTTAGKCDPCRGVDKSLEDKLLQSALGKTRLVRVDIDVFHDDLEVLKMPIKAIPGFFLLSPDLTPKDAINGGEWDDDVPRNIAPVLGAFVRGDYKKRRETWKAGKGSGIRL